MNTEEESANQEISKGEQRRRTKEKVIRAAKIKKIVPWIILVGALVGALYWIAITTEKDMKNRPGEEMAIQGTAHIKPSDAHEPYNSNPPTSGPHADPVPWGFSEEQVLDENAVHNLEHGGIWITYKNIDDASVDILRGIAAKNALSVIVSPREANDSDVALASWGRLKTMDSVDVAAINEFIKKNKNQSPERLAR